ncbi:integrase family protein [Marinobacter santoriniensis]|nr:integrase family protein [Marinobacter santoriniensis]
MKEKLTEKLVKDLAATGKRYEVRDSVMPGLMVRVAVSGSKSYYFDYRSQDGKRNKYRIGSTDAVALSDAREVARKKGGEVAHGKNLNAEKKEKKRKAEVEKIQKLGIFIEEVWEPWRKAERKRAEEDISRLKLHFGSWYKLPVSQIDKVRVGKWRQKRLEAGISPRTINKDVAILMSVVSKATEHGVVKTNPLKGWKQLKIDTREKVRFLSDKEEERLREVLERREADARKGRDNHNYWLYKRRKPLRPMLTDQMYSDHIYPLIMLAIHTGLRPEELLSIEWKDIDLRHKTVTVRGEIAKSGRTRHVPLSSEGCQVVRRWQRSKDGQQVGLVFPGKTGGIMDRMPRAVTKTIREAKIKDFRPYDFRHTFASRLALGGIDLNTIRELMGHEDISQTLIYAHLTHDHRKEAVARVFG